MLIRVLIALAVLALLAACGGSQGPGVHNGFDATEILNAPPPDGVDAQLWRELTRELARVVAARPRNPSEAAFGRSSEVRDLTVAPSIPTFADLDWTYRCQGDYDLNGEVNISDLTPIAVHFGKTSSDDNWTAHQLADGDGNGQVTISDISPLGANLGAFVAGYLVQSKAFGGSEFENTGIFVPYGAGQPSLGKYPELHGVLSNPEVGSTYRVVPSATSSAPYELGIPSVAVLYTGLDPQQPWSQFGGNAQRNGLSRFDGPVSAGSVWNLDLDGLCFDRAGPVADDTGVVYCTSSKIDLAAYPDLSSSSGSIWAVNRDGSVRWRFKVDAALPVQPILLADRTVVASTYRHELIAVYSDGKLRWRQQLSDDGHTLPWHLAYTAAHGIYAIDAGPNLRNLDENGTIRDTVALTTPETDTAPVIAETWIFFNDDVTGDIHKHLLSDCSFVTTSALDAAFDGGMFAKIGTSRLWVSTNGLHAMQGISMFGAQAVNYDSSCRIWNLPALAGNGNIVAGEIVDGATPQDPYTGRLVGLDDLGAVTWDRPLALIPTGGMACGFNGGVYAGAYQVDDDNNLTEARFYCVDAQHNVAFSVPVEGMPNGISIAAGGYAAGIFTDATGQQTSYLVGIDSN